MSLDLSGRWEASGYQCPWGTFHTEVVEVAHEGEQIVAVKIIGDDCVPAGFETLNRPGFHADVVVRDSGCVSEGG